MNDRALPNRVPVLGDFGSQYQPAEVADPVVGSDSVGGVTDRWPVEPGSQVVGDRRESLFADRDLSPVVLERLLLRAVVEVLRVQPLAMGLVQYVPSR
jgi:hypothetical protein